MKSLIFIFALIVSTQMLFAQPFTAVPTSPPFEGERFSASVFADVDGDGDDDVLISGQTNEDSASTVLYTNDGMGNFSAVAGTPFVGVRYSAVAFADVDGDGDLDVMISGRTDQETEITSLYTNDGAGKFTEVAGTPFTASENGTILFFDADGDMDEDVFITGFSSPATVIAKLYTNDGAGVFTEVMGTPFVGVRASGAAVADVEGDGDLDLYVSGEDATETPQTEVYINDGSGGFTQLGVDGFPDLRRGTVDFADIDGDGDEDIFLTGLNSAGFKESNLYANDGGSFFLVNNTGLEAVDNSAVEFADIDGDGDQDLFMTGQEPFFTRVAKLYINDGPGTFTENTGVPFTGVLFGSISVADVDGDSNLDVLLTGQTITEARIAELFLGDGAGSYEAATGSILEGVRFGEGLFADVDGDGDADVLISGQSSGDSASTKLYTNDGTGIFTEVLGTPFEGVRFSTAAFADVDNDGDLDVMISGRTDQETEITSLYTNDGVGTFTVVAGTSFTPAEDGTILFFDADGDMDEDVFITGFSSPATVIAKLYTNDGAGVFTEVMGTPFVGVRASGAAVADIEGDGDLDLYVSGEDATEAPQTEVYINDGSGGFTQFGVDGFPDLRRGTVDFADIDGDGDEDIFLTGLNSAGFKESNLYANNGGSFSLINNTGLEAVDNSAVEFADIDGDGDQDILITGQEPFFTRIANLYLNDGTGIFTLETGTPFIGVLFSSVAIADIDGDSDLDVLLTGQTITENRIARLYTNDRIMTSIGLEVIAIDMTLFPNPAISEQTTLRSTYERVSEVQIQMFDVMGNLVQQRYESMMPGTQDLTLSTKGLASGLYFVQVQIGEGQKTMKLLVE